MNKDTKKFYDKVRAAIGEATSLSRIATSSLTPQALGPAEYKQLMMAISDMISGWEAWLEFSHKTTAELKSRGKGAPH